MSQRSQGNVYGLSGPLGLSTVWVMLTSKGPPNGTASAVVNARGNPFNCPTAPSPVEGRPPDPDSSGNKPSCVRDVG